MGGIKLQPKKVGELEGAELDYWVAKAMPMPGFAEGHWDDEGVYHWRDMVIQDGRVDNQFTPSQLWDHGGPIIEREKLHLMYCGPRGRKDHDAFWSADADSKVRVLSDPETGQPMSALASGFGPTPLIAAMRAYVASKFGDEVTE